MSKNQAFQDVLTEVMKLVNFIVEDYREDQPPSPRVEEQGNRVVDMMMQFPDIQENFTREDVRKRFAWLATYLDKRLRDATKDDLIAFLDEMFEKRFVYNFFFRAPLLKGFPDGFQIGYGRLTSFKKLPEEVKNFISSWWEFRFKEDSSAQGLYTKTFEEYKERRENEVYLCLEVISNGPDKAVLLATEKANQSFSILKTVYMVDVPSLRECTYYVAEKEWYGGSDYSRWISLPHNSHLDESLRLINVIYSKTQPNELERSVKKAIEIHGMIEITTPLDIKFLLTVIAMEGLVVGGEEKDYIGWRFAERIALLLGDSPGWLYSFLEKNMGEVVTEEEINKNLVRSRMELNKRMIDIYGKRSGLAHSRVGRKKSKEIITEDDFRFAESVFSLLLWEILDLCVVRGIRSIGKKDDNSLARYLDKIKFASRA